MDFFIQTPAQLGAALRSRRKDLKLSQKEAASQVGLLPKTISYLENSPTASSVESLFKLISALNMNLILSPKAAPGRQLKDSEW